jgi:hypothetical protein
LSELCIFVEIAFLKEFAKGAQMTSYDKQMISRELRRVGANVRKGTGESMTTALDGLSTIRKLIEQENAVIAEGDESGNNGNKKKVVLKPVGSGRKKPVNDEDSSEG